MKSAEYWIKRLGLQKHPEGGWFAETYRSTELIDEAALAPRYGGARCMSTDIYFLVESDAPSRLHRVNSDEIWHYHDGSPLTIHIIDGKGRYQPASLGTDFDDGSRPQVVVPCGTWFGATVDDPGSYTLVSCTVAPGFDFADFELGTREKLCKLFPQHRELVESLTASGE
jgi:predicted cupin superfamily sugar epimerase